MSFKHIVFVGGIILFITYVKCLSRCKQQEFCEDLRQRSSSEFMLKLSSKLDNSLIGILVNKRTNTYFDFFLTALTDGKFSICINDPIYPRHQVNNSLTDMPEEVSMKVNVSILETNSSEVAHIEFKEIKIILYTDPFNITAYREDVEIIKINSRQLLAFDETPNTTIGLDIIFPQAIRAYGIPEHAEKMSLKTTTNGSEPYRLYNADRYGYEVNSQESLYGSVPVLYCHGRNISAGVFWINSAQTFVDITHKEEGIETYFMSESGALEAYFLTGPSLKRCVQQYASLTGVAPLPQMFALGYHQSRFSYVSEQEVLTVCKNFDESQFPMDAIWLDIDYTQKKQYFTWNPVTFPTPDAMLDALKKQGRKAVAVIDPHVKIEDGYFVFDECEAKGYFVKDANGKDFKSVCWPGLSSWIDFFNVDALNYYSGLVAEFAKNENLYIWISMNEPSVFESDEKTMNGNCIHDDGWTHRDIHNQYGLYQTIGTYDGLMEKGDYKIRPFILSRSYFAGSQRYAAHWTGDNVASWQHLKISISMILTDALAGLSFVGADVGGFTSNPNEELLQRWYQAGAWYPFFRSHSSTGTKRREPYLFKEEIKTRLKKSLYQRYQHLTYWYTLFWEHYKTGEPVVRPVTYQYSNDLNTFDIDDEILIGSDILVHPVTDQSAKYVSVYLPGGKDQLWYNIDDFNETFSGMGYKNFSVTLDSVPVFYRGGSIIPVKLTFKNSSMYMKNDPVTLLIFLSKEKSAVGNIYDDDNESFNYLENKYSYVNFNFSNNTLRNEIIDKDSSYDQPTILSSIIIYGFNTNLTQVSIQKDRMTKSNEGISISIDFQNMVVCGFQRYNKTIIIDNLKIDIRREFIIKFDESVPE